MTAEEYQDLIDARDAESAMRAVSDGTMQTWPVRTWTRIGRHRWRPGAVIAR